MDLQQKRFFEAYKITKVLFSEMQQKCSKHNITLCFLLIPSMEFNFYEYLQKQNCDIPAVYHQLVTREQHIFDDITTFFEKQSIHYITISQRMRKALIEVGNIYPSDDNGHPFQSGYKIYAQAVHEYLQKKELLQKSR